MAARHRCRPGALGTSLTPEEFGESIGRGILKALLDVKPPEATGKAPSKNRSRGGTHSPPGADTVIPGEVATPSFDQVDSPLPGFEGIPRATLREMESAMEKITRGQGPPPGFYDPDEADSSVPLS